MNQSSVGNYFDRTAATFDSIYLDESPFQRRVNEIFRKAIYERFHIALEESGDVTNKTVLDIGCGSGHYVVEYAKRGAARVVGLDLSSNMLALARDLVQREGVAERCDFVQGDFLAASFPEKFDIVVAMGVFDYVDDPIRFLAQMAKHSRGLVIASFPAKNAVRMHFRKFRYNLRNCPLFFYSESDLNAIVSKAGFREHKIVVMPHSGRGFVLIGRV